MAQIAESQATLRIMGDDLVPGEISDLLGCEASRQQTTGEELVAPKSGRTRVARSGMWRLFAKKREPEDLDGQVSELLGKLTDDLAVWADLSARFKIDLFVGLFMNVTNEGCSVSAETLRKLGERGIELGLDI